MKYPWKNIEMRKAGSGSGEGRGQMRETDGGNEDLAFLRKIITGATG